MKKKNSICNPPFEVLAYRVSVEKLLGKPDSVPEAIVKIKIGDEVRHIVAEGDGPVNALDNAMRRALLSFYPQLKEVRLVDYWVRIVNGGEGTAASVEVLIVSSDGKDTWITKGYSTNIIQASLEALENSLKQAILKKVSVS